MVDKATGWPVWFNGLWQMCMDDSDGIEDYDETDDDAMDIDEESF